MSEISWLTAEAQRRHIQQCYTFIFQSKERLVIRLQTKGVSLKDNNLGIYVFRKHNEMFVLGSTQLGRKLSLKPPCLHMTLEHAALMTDFLTDLNYVSIE